MNRRRFLGVAATSGVALIAGCGSSTNEQRSVKDPKPPQEILSKTKQFLDGEFKSTVTLNYSVTVGERNVEFKMKTDGKYDVRNKQLNTNGIVNVKESGGDISKEKNLDFIQYFRDGILYQNPVLRYQTTLNTDYDFQNVMGVGQSVVDDFDLQSTVVSEENPAYKFSRSVTDIDEIRKILQSSTYDMYGDHQFLESVTQYIDKMKITLSSNMSSGVPERLIGEVEQEFSNGSMDINYEVTYEDVESVNLGPIPSDARVTQIGQ